MIKRNKGSLHTTRVLWKEVTLDKGTELFDAWEKTATDFLEIGVKMQKQLLEDWSEVTDTLRETSANLGGERERVPGMRLFNLYTSGVSTMFGASKILVDEIIKMQETWKHALANQIEMGKEMAKNWA
jgi:hypothetical protein